MSGVIGHIINPTASEAAALAVEAENHGASWIGLADAFWWRDVWMLLAEVARATERIHIGPAMTNPYLRHPFHTASAIATLQELAGDRTLVGIAAGGSEVTLAAGLSRSDAAERVRDLIDVVEAVSSGQPLDPSSARRLDLYLARPTILVAGRGDQMLRAAGERADEVLLWAIPDSELQRSIELVRQGAAGRKAPPSLVWAPLVRHRPEDEASLMHVAVYASLNTRRPCRLAWGLDDDLVNDIRSALVSGGTSHATSLVPSTALDDLVLTDTSPEAVADRARDLGISAVATPGFAADTLGEQLYWAHEVEALL